MNAYIDGDILVYRAAFAAEYTEYTLGDVSVRGRQAMLEYLEDKEETLDDVTTERIILSPAIAKKNLKSLVDRVYGRLFTLYGPFAPWVALSTGRETHRHLNATQKYKDKRAPKPVHYKVVRDMLMNDYAGMEYRTVEADDAIAIQQTTVLEKGERSVIVSIDKDLLQVEGEHYNFVTDERRWISGEEAEHAFLIQCITGDSTDNIPGAYGFGQVKAAKALAETDDPAEAIANCWEAYKKKKPEHYAGIWGDTPLEEAIAEVRMLVSIGDHYARTHISEAEWIQIKAGTGCMF